MNKKLGMVCEAISMSLVILVIVFPTKVARAIQSLAEILALMLVILFAPKNEESPN